MGTFWKNLALGASAFAIMAPASAIAQDAVYQFDIPAQDLGAALRAYGQQAGQQLGYDASVTQGKQSTALVGGYSADEGLMRLLEGTALRFERSVAGVLVISDPTSPTRLGDARGAASSDDGATAEILVIGSRSLNTDIRRTEDDAQPYVVIDSEEIQRSGATTVEQLLLSRLPMNAANATSTQQPQTVDNSGAINLRGLGANQTLVLVNGRRVPGIAPPTFAGQAGDIGQASLSGIPLSAIERIEVLPATASGIYGGGATGGVINVILRNDYSGIEVSATYGDTFSFEMPSTRLDVSGGASFDGGRTHVSFYLSDRESGDLRAYERNFARDAKLLQRRNDPASEFASFFPAVGSTPNICSAIAFSPTFGACGGGPLTLRDGTPIGSSITSVPSGYSLTSAGDLGLALADGAGAYNLNLPRSSESILREPTVRSFSLTLNREFTDTIEAYAVARYSETEGEGGGTPSSFVFLAEDNPVNPFQQPVVVAWPLPQVAPQSRSETTESYAGAGLIARLGAGWAANLDYSWSRSESSGSTSGALSFIGESRLRTEEIRDPFAFPLVFDDQDLAPIPQYVDGPRTISLHDAAVRFSGPTIDLPGGPLTVTASLGYRLETGEEALSLFAPNFYTLHPEKTRSVFSMTTEVSVPLISARNAVPLVRELEIQGAVRRDEYSLRSSASALQSDNPDGPFDEPVFDRADFSSTDYTVAFRYQPIEDVTLRASYGTGFLPVSLGQLATSTSQQTSDIFGSLLDPRRGNTPVSAPNRPIEVSSGGTIDLLPEQSSSLSFGVIWTPTLLEGLRLSADYIRVRKSDEVAAIASLDFLLANEARFPERIIRAAPVDGDPEAWAGPIIGFDETAINIAHSSVEAIDFQINYTKELGTGTSVEVYAVGTYNIEFERQTFPDTASFDIVGGSDFSAPLQWRGNLGATLSHHNWTLGWNAQYFHSYDVAYHDPAFAALNPTRLQSQGSAQISSQVYHDLVVGYAFPAEGATLPGLAMQLGMQNIFNSEPPILATTAYELSPGGGYSTYGDPRLRRFVLSVRQAF